MGDVHCVSVCKPFFFVEKKKRQTDNIQKRSKIIVREILTVIAIFSRIRLSIRLCVYARVVEEDLVIIFCK